MLGALFAALTGAGMGLQTTITRRAMLFTSALSGITITVSLGVPLFLIAALLSGHLFKASELSVQSYLLLMGAGVMHFLLGRYSVYRAISAMGSTRTSPLIAMTAPVSVLMAVFILGEEVNALMAVGILMVLSGPAIMVRRSNPQPGQRPPGVEAADIPGPGSPPGPMVTATDAAASAISHPGQSTGLPPLRMTEGYLFGLLAAVGYGSSPIMIRTALEDSGISMLGGLVSYAAATVVLMLMLTWPSRRAAMQGMDGRALRLLLVGGVLVFGAQMSRYVALSIAPVSLVAPLGQLSPVFVVIFSFLFNRRIESFGPRVLIGILLAMTGSIAVTLGR